MGQSTNAILFYGYCWDDETSRPWTLGKNEGEDDGEDWEKRYARVKGVLPPTTPYPERQVKATRENGWSSTPKDYTPAEQAVIDQWRAYWEVEREVVKNAGVEVDTHCSGECPMPFVAITASKILSHRGYMNEVKNLEVDPTWDGMLQAFCQDMGINIEGKRAAWWLVSDWN